MITLRKARPADIPQLIALLKELFTIEADFYFDPKKQTDGLSLLINSEKDCVLVAHMPGDNKVLELCSVQTLISTAEGGCLGRRSRS